jgi:hypothetical protein
MTAAAISCRMQLGWKADNPALVGGVKLLQQSPPKPEARNAYYFQWGTRALKSVGGEAWKEWQRSMNAFLIETQDIADGEDTGSWRWENDTLGQAGGRHLITSLSLLSLEQCAADELKPAPVKPRVLRTDEQAGLWQELAGTDLFRVRQSMAEFTSDPRGSVAYLKAKLQPTAQPDAEKLASLVSDLDAGSFAVRRRAAEELERQMEFVEPALRKVLEDKPSLELRQRVERLLQTVEEKPVEALQRLRAVTVLERLSTPEARDVLKHLATGAPGAWQTREAKAALTRLEKVGLSR